MSRTEATIDDFPLLRTVISCTGVVLIEFADGSPKQSQRWP